MALYVTAFEESIKGIALYFASAVAEGESLSTPAQSLLNAVLAGPTSHKRRHAIAALGDFLAGLMTAPEPAESRSGLVIELMGRIFSITSGDTRMVEEWRAIAVKAGINVGRKSHQSWFDRAWELRQAGLYVDPIGESWHAPSSVTEKQVSEGRRHVIGLVRMTKFVIREPFSSEEAATLRAQLAGLAGPS